MVPSLFCGESLQSKLQRALRLIVEEIVAIVLSTYLYLLRYENASNRRYNFSSGLAIPPALNNTYISRKPRRRDNPQGPSCYCCGRTARYNRIDGSMKVAVVGRIDSNGRSADFVSSHRLAVAAVFEQVKPLQDQLAQIASILEPIGQLSELGNVFEPLRQFGTQIKGLAKLLEPMRSFQDQLRQVLNQFGPLQALDQELDQLSEGFCQSLSSLATALEPAVTLQDRLAHLARRV